MKRLHILCLTLLISVSTLAQSKLEKASQSVKANKDVTINLNTNYTNIIIDTWGKDVIEIEAYMESDELSKDALKPYFDNWHVAIEGSGDYVSINSDASNHSWAQVPGFFNDESAEALRTLELELANIPIVEGLIESINFSDMPKMPKLPKLPKLPKGMTDTNFDYEKYQKEGEAYLEKWSKEYESKYGDEYAKKMEAWAKEWESSDEMKDFEKRMEAWGEKFGKEFGEKFGKDMEAWGEEFGEKFGKDMEAWGEQFGKQMEAWGEAYGRRMELQAKRLEARANAEAHRQNRMHEREKHLEERQKYIEERAHYRSERDAYRQPHLKVKKTIIIKMPKKANLKMNVRHGELKVTSVIYNTKADLSYTTLIADSIDGSQTSINASYSPVTITNWNMGELKLNFVDKAAITNADRLVLSSNSSNIKINTLQKNAIIDGSFGDLIIKNIADTFSNLNVVLENSEAVVYLPKTDYNLQYKGKQSRLKHPKNNSNQNTSSFSTGNLTSDKTIVINAKFSDVIMQ
ncbi:hypothetical protein [Corallibacter sp.]|uniref:hypothetical protein n=1 Tax=Corallibacter sp. TaxID=2038084 RepID=UPI003AB4314D